MSKSILFLLIVFPYAIHAQSFKSEISYGKFFTGFQDKWGEKLGVNLNVEESNIFIDVGYNFAISDQKNDVRLSLKALTYDNDNVDFPFKKESEYIRFISKQTGWKFEQGGLDKIIFREAELKLGYNIPFKRLSFSPFGGMALNWISSQIVFLEYDGKVSESGPFGKIVDAYITVPQIVRSIDYGFLYGFKFQVYLTKSLQIGVLGRDVYYKHSVFDNVSISALVSTKF